MPDGPVFPVSPVSPCIPSGPLNAPIKTQYPVGRSTLLCILGNTAGITEARNEYSVPVSLTTIPSPFVFPCVGSTIRSFNSSAVMTLPLTTTVPTLTPPIVLPKGNMREFPSDDIAVSPIYKV